MAWVACASRPMLDHRWPLANLARRAKWRCLYLLFALAVQDLLLCAKHLFDRGRTGSRRSQFDHGVGESAAWTVFRCRSIHPSRWSL